MPINLIRKRFHNAKVVVISESFLENNSFCSGRLMVASSDSQQLLIRCFFN